jgi:hypothetical protein
MTIETHDTMPGPPQHDWDRVALQLLAGEVVSVPAPTKYTRHSAVICLSRRGIRVTTSVRDGRLYLQAR